MLNKHNVKSWVPKQTPKKSTIKQILAKKQLMSASLIPCTRGSFKPTKIIWFSLFFHRYCCSLYMRASLFPYSLSHVVMRRKLSPYSPRGTKLLDSLHLRANRCLQRAYNTLRKPGLRKMLCKFTLKLPVEDRESGFDKGWW